MLIFRGEIKGIIIINLSGFPVLMGPQAVLVEQSNWESGTLP
jgi:hypothetical protein